MEPRAPRDGQSNGGARSAESSSLSEVIAQGRELAGAATAGAMGTAATGLRSLQDNVGALANTATQFASETGADVASRTAVKAKSWGDQLESLARGNPLGALLGAVLIGALLGMRGRGRRR